MGNLRVGGMRRQPGKFKYTPTAKEMIITLTIFMIMIPGKDPTYV